MTRNVRRLMATALAAGALAGALAGGGGSPAASAFEMPLGPVADCTPFASFEEAQVYYAAHPDMQPVIDPDWDGLACEVYFFGGDPWTSGGSGAGGSGADSGVRTGFGGLDGVDYDCWDFSSQAAAQGYFERDGGSARNNADGLDRNHNGLACEPGEFD